MEKGFSRMTGKTLRLPSLKSCSGERNAVKAPQLRWALGGAECVRFAPRARCVREEVVVLPRGHGYPLHDKMPNISE